METTEIKDHANIDLSRVRLSHKLIESLRKFQTRGWDTEQKLVDADFNNGRGQSYLDDITDIILFLVSLDAEGDIEKPEQIMELMGKLYYIRCFLEDLKAPETDV